MTAFEAMRIKQLLQVIEKCCLSETELRELREQIHSRVIQKVMESERALIYGKPKDGRRNGRTSRKRVPLSYRLEKKVQRRKTASI